MEQEDQKRNEELLTADEHRAIQMAGDLWRQLCLVVGQGRTRDSDLRKLVIHVHAIQHAVMAQAAARAYPEQYRLAGGSLPDKPQALRMSGPSVVAVPDLEGSGEG